jgi:hypothetical protein
MLHATATTTTSTSDAPSTRAKKLGYVPGSVYFMNVGRIKNCNVADTALIYEKKRLVYADRSMSLGISNRVARTNATFKMVLSD